MKWWQLLWLLNENLGFLQSVLSAPEWDQYRQWLTDRELIRKTQRRDILDAVVPRELCLKALAGCQYRFVADNGHLYGGFPKTHTEKLSANEAYLRFGGFVLVDAIDRGIAKVDDCEV